MFHVIIKTMMSDYVHKLFAPLINYRKVHVCYFYNWCQITFLKTYKARLKYLHASFYILL